MKPAHCTCWRRTASTSARTSDTAARSSVTASSARFTGGAGSEGNNTFIPYQPERPNRALRLRSYPVKEQYGCIFMWYHPAGSLPRWELPDIMRKFPQFETDPNAYYRPYPEFSRRADAVPVHPQIVAENGPDSSHFRYVHGATVTPVCLHWEHEEQEWRFVTGWPDARSDDPEEMALRIHSHFSGLGFAMSAFEGSSNHRLIFACTPVDDEVSDMFYSIWWPKETNETSDIPPDHVCAHVEKQFLKTVWEDCDIWRHQKYVERPHWPKSTPSPTWPCANGRPNSTKYQPKTNPRGRDAEALDNPYL